MNKLSPRAQRLLMALAQDQAIKLGSDTIDIEHVFLALLESADGLGYVTLKTLNINVLTLKLVIEQSLPAKLPSKNFRDIPMSDRLKFIMMTAGVESKALGKNYTGTEHIILGTLREETNIISRFFKNAGMDFETVQNAVISVEKKIPSSANSDLALESVANVFPSSGKNAGDLSYQKSNGTDDRNVRELNEYCRDVTKDAELGKLDAVIGREDEIERIVQILSRRTKNNPVLVGEPGVGKTAIVEGLAQKIVNSQVPKNLLKKRIYAMDLASMVAGTKYRGEFEERLKNLMKVLKRDKNIIIFIDELHTIIGAGGPEGSMDASNIMKPALSRGEMQVIGATTTKEYRKYFEKDSALVRRFQKVSVKEPDAQQTLEILKGIKSRYEEFHNVVYGEGVLEAVVQYSTRYISERQQPDKAIDILDEAGSCKKIREDRKPSQVIELERQVERLTAEKKEFVQQQDYERAAMVRDKLNQVRMELEEESHRWKSESGEKIGTVTVEDIRSVISLETGIPVKSLDDGEAQRLMNMEEELHQQVIGQHQAVRLISSAVRRSRSGISSPNRPLGSFLFLGPTGVGKTQLAKTLSQFLFGTKDALIRVDMSDYMEKFNASRLVGAPPGYVGYDEGGALTEKVRQHPYSIVLLDEIEKAHPDVYNLLLQMLEEGELSDNLGHTVSFRNCIIIMTSNAGARQISAENRLGFSGNKEGLMTYDEIKSNAVHELKKIMNPEILNRIDEIVVFEPLSKENLEQILSIQLEDLENRLKVQKLTLEVKPKAKDYLIQKGYEPEMGARPMRRLISSEVENIIADLLISQKAEEGQCIVIDMEDDKLNAKYRKSRKSAKSKKLPEAVSETIIV